MGLPDAFHNNRGDVIYIGVAQQPAVVPGSAGLGAGDDAHSKVEGVVLGAHLFDTVLGGGALFFLHLHPHIAVAQVGKLPGIFGNQGAYLGPHLLQELYVHGPGHQLVTAPWAAEVTSRVYFARAPVT